MFVCYLPICSRKGLASDLICMAVMLARCVDDVRLGQNGSADGHGVLIFSCCECILCSTPIYQTCDFFFFLGSPLKEINGFFKFKKNPVTITVSSPGSL